MWRWMAALALVAGSWLSLAQAQQPQQAQYVRIKIDLNEYKIEANSAGKFGQPGKVGQPNGMPPGIPGIPNGMPPAPVSDEPPIWVEIHLPIAGSQALPGKTPTGKSVFRIDYKLGAGKGTSYVLGNDIKSFVQFNLKTRFDTKRKTLDKSVTEIGLLDLAEFALQRGMMKEFTKTMDELTKKFDKNPIGQVYTKVHNELKNSPNQDDPVVGKLALGSSYKKTLSGGGYYSLYSQLDGDSSAVKERLEQLERTYESFYYWFALRGKSLPQPKHRLIAVLEETPAGFKAKTSAFTARPLSQAGFLAQSQNVIFLAPQPVDPIFAYLDVNNKNYCKEFSISPSLLLKGTLPPGLDNDNAAKLSTRALFEKMMEEDSARATTTHEAIQQLLAVADVLPRNVLTADWLRYGIASFFETPRLAFFDCTAMPSWTNLAYFRHYRDKTDEQTQKRIGALSDDQRAMVLYKTITDEYFSQANIALKLAENSDNRIVAYTAAREHVRIAQSSAWSFTYYLMHKDLNKVFAYCNELRQLPREIEYSPPVLAACFGKAFGLPVNPDPASALRLDLQNLDGVAGAWYGYIGSPAIGLDIQGVEDELIRGLDHPEKKKAETAPGGFGGTGM